MPSGGVGIVPDHREAEGVRADLEPAGDTGTAGDVRRCPVEGHTGLHRRGDRPEGVVDGEVPGGRDAHRQLPVPVHQPKTAAVRPDLDPLCNIAGVRRPVGEGHRPAGERLSQQAAVGIVQVEHRRIAHGKEPALGGKVLLHRVVEVQVVLGEVGEHRHLEVEPVHPVLGQRMGGDLHHHILTARRRHLGQQRLELVGVRGGVFGGEGDGVDLVFHRADEPGPVAGGGKQMLDQKDAGGLAVGAGDADELHLLRRTATLR